MYKKKGKGVEGNQCIHHRLFVTHHNHRRCLGPGSLEGRVGVGEELLEVGLEPLASLGSGLEGIRQAAVVVVAGSRGVAGAVALATGLDPDEGIKKVVAGVGSRAGTEAGALGVAPVTPLGLACCDVRVGFLFLFSRRITVEGKTGTGGYVPVGCLPLRPESVMNLAGKPAAFRSGLKAST